MIKFFNLSRNKITLIKYVGLFLLGSVLIAPTLTLRGASEKVSYYLDIKPVIQQYCQGCHQPALRQGNLDLTNYKEFVKGGKNGLAFVVGQPDSSLVVGMIEGRHQPLMPLGGPPLEKKVINQFRSWIRAGAGDDTPSQNKILSNNAFPTYQLPPVITAMAYSPDGRLLAVSGYREILLHRSDGTGLEGRLVGVSDRLQSLDFTPDGQILVTAGGIPARFGELQFWEIQTRKLKHSVTVCKDTLFGASLSPNGSKVGFGCSDHTVRIHEISTGIEFLRTRHHENWVLGTQFGMDGKRIVSVGRDFAVKLMNAETGAFVENLNALRKELMAVSRHPTRDAVVVGGEERIPYYYLMDRPSKMIAGDEATLIRKFQRQNGEIFVLEFSPDGKKLAVAGAAPKVAIYDVATGDLLVTCQGHQAGIYAIAFHPKRNEIATAGFDGRVRIYEVESGNILKEFIPVPLEKQAVLSN